ncbi:MAG: cobalamin-binding protein [Rhodothermales bacterium]
MRVVSLLPAATEWLYTFGAGDLLVGRSHACDYPAAARDLPAVTRSTFRGDGDSAAIDAAVRDTVQRGLSLYDVDLDALRTLAPDLVVTQAQCDVCAVSLDTLEAALADWTGARPQVFSLEPMTFKQVLDAALRLGRTVGRLPDAMRVVADGERRLRDLHERIGRRRDGTLADRPTPTVACIEWIEPLMTAGHWAPDLVDLAGGRTVCAEAGAPSQYVAWDAIVAADPDVLAVVACGLGVEQALRDLHFLSDRPEWTALRAVRDGRVFVFDGDAYFNRPGPRLVRSVELLAAAFHGDAGAEPESWEMRSLAATSLPSLYSR